jgi:hypothetical protein
VRSYDWQRRVVTMSSKRRPGNADEIKRKFWELQFAQRKR